MTLFLQREENPMTRRTRHAQPRRRRIASFNMVEVALAMAVIALGVLSIMALFPVGLAASRDAIADSYSADSAEQLLHYFAEQGKSNWAAAITDPITGLPTSKPSGGEGWSPVPGSADFTGPTAVLEQGSAAGVYRLTQKTAATEDFQAVYRLWRTDAEYKYHDGGNWVDGTVAPDYGVVLNLEVGWPAAAPEGKRQTALYTLEVFNPTPPAP
jgi:hypothetical protein